MGDKKSFLSPPDGAGCGMGIKEMLRKGKDGNRGVKTEPQGLEAAPCPGGWGLCSSSPLLKRKKHPHLALVKEKS